MEPMTGIERISRILKRLPVDRIGLFEHFWRIRGNNGPKKVI